MFEDLIGGGIFVVLAGVLWLVYLLPSWSKRNEYLATERNTIRLQQTLRALSETSELPQQLTVELSKEAVASHEKLLKERTHQTEKSERSLLRSQLQQQRQAAQEALAARFPHSREQLLARIRTVKIVAALLALAGVIGMVVSGAQLFSGEVSALWLIAGSLGAVAGSGLLLVRLNATERKVLRRSAPKVSQRARIELPELGEELSERSVEASAEWQPVPLPKPLYLAQSSVNAERAAALAEAERIAERELLERLAAREREARTLRQAARLREASEQSQQKLREAQRQTPSIRQAPSVAAKREEQDRFAAMGVVDVSSAEMDLSEILRRRRNAG